MATGSSLARSLRRVFPMNPKVRSVGRNCHRTNATVSYAEPTTLLITCMDRRVNPDVYLKMDLGSTFILRNPGNFVPHAADVPTSQSSSELAALELTVNILNLKNIIVCGHSDCKAIHTLRGLKQCCVPPEAHQGPLATWLKTGGKRTWYKYLTEQQKEGYHTMFSNISDSKLMSRLDPESKLCTEDRISQINVLQQIENICSHNFLKDTLRGNSVQLQGMWVDVHDQTTHIFNWQKMRFVEVQSVKEQVHDRT